MPKTELKQLVAAELKGFAERQNERELVRESDRIRERVKRMRRAGKLRTLPLALEQLDKTATPYVREDSYGIAVITVMESLVIPFDRTGNLSYDPPRRRGPDTPSLQEDFQFTGDSEDTQDLKWFDSIFE